MALILCWRPVRLCWLIAAYAALMNLERCASKTGVQYEAMEQQTVSVAKAGLVCVLNSRASIIAAMNPVGKYDSNCDLSMNTRIASPLLSRFDIVLVLLDDPDDEWDKRVSEFLLKKHMYGGCEAAGSADDDAAAAAKSNFCKVNGHRVWSKEKLQAYITLLKTWPRAPLEESARMLIKTYYKRQRGASGSDNARTTIRLLESLIRIAQAHARLMWRNVVTLDDAVIAVSIIELSMNTGFALSENAVAHIDFPDDPEQDYINNRERLLRFLGLMHLVPSYGSGDEGGDGGGGRDWTPRTTTMDVMKKGM